MSPPAANMSRRMSLTSITSRAYTTLPSPARTAITRNAPPPMRQRPPARRSSPMEFTTPEPLRNEHEELHEVLRKATKEGGAVGKAAKALAKLMHPHFVKEDA